MTMLAHAAISHAIAEVGLHDPAAILGRTDTALRAMLSASHLDSALATHADAALIYVDRAAGHMAFSGAKMSLYICDDGRVEEIKEPGVHWLTSAWVSSPIQGFRSRRGVLTIS